MMEKQQNILEKYNAFKCGLAWNYVSVIILSASGFLFTILISCYYNPETLGVFNQVYAWYIVLSQISVMGIQAAVTKYCAEYCQQVKILLKIISSAVIAVLGTSLLTTLGIYLLIPVLSHGSDNLELGLRQIVPALLFFSLNKVFLGILNGLSEMKAYAVFQSLRYILLVSAIWGMALLHIDGNLLNSCFLISEILLTTSILIYFLKHKLLILSCNWSWIKKNIEFGIRIMPANLVLEINSKVDVLCLGFILGNDYLVGIYSFAILFAEGFYQLFITLRRSLNPYITRKYYEGTLQQEIIMLKRKYQKYYYCIVPVLAVVLILVYYTFCYILGDIDYLKAKIPLIIVTISIASNGYSIILGNLLAQIGEPVHESYINILTVAINFIGNIIMIYVWGMIGAAIATAVSYFAFSFMLRNALKKQKLTIL